MQKHRSEREPTGSTNLQSGALNFWKMEGAQKVEFKYVTFLRKYTFGANCDQDVILDGFSHEWFVSPARWGSCLREFVGANYCHPGLRRVWKGGSGAQLPPPFRRKSRKCRVSSCRPRMNSGRAPMTVKTQCTGPFFRKMAMEIHGYPWISMES